MGLITENNEQYYAGSQRFLSIAGTGQKFTATFDTNLILGSSDPSQVDYALNNFKLYTALPSVLTYTEYILPYTVADNVITIAGTLALNTSVVIQLKSLEGGQYGNRDAFGQAVEDNYCLLYTSDAADE